MEQRRWVTRSGGREACARAARRGGVCAAAPVAISQSKNCTRAVDSAPQPPFGGKLCSPVRFVRHREPGRGVREGRVRRGVARSPRRACARAGFGGIGGAPVPVPSDSSRGEGPEARAEAREDDEVAVRGAAHPLIDGSISRHSSCKRSSSASRSPCESPTSRGSARSPSAASGRCTKTTGCVSAPASRRTSPRSSV